MTAGQAVPNPLELLNLKVCQVAAGFDCGQLRLGDHRQPAAAVCGRRKSAVNHVRRHDAGRADRINHLRTVSRGTAIACAKTTCSALSLTAPDGANSIANTPIITITIRRMRRKKKPLRTRLRFSRGPAYAFQRFTTSALFLLPNAMQFATA